MPTLSPTLRPQGSLGAEFFFLGIIIIFKIYNYDFSVAVVKVDVKLWSSLCKTWVQLLAVHGFCHSLSISFTPRCAALSTALNLEEILFCTFEPSCKIQKRIEGLNWDFRFLVFR